MKYCIFDVETSVDFVPKNGDKKTNRKATPFYKGNNIVAWGAKTDYETLVEYNGHVVIPGYTEILVGHNLKFDLLYLLRKVPYGMEWFHNYILGGGKFWDTQVAEYLISGQTLLYPSLNYCAEKYGGTLKDDKIAQYWDSGVRTEDIPEDELLEYLHGDLNNTEIVFLEQLKAVKALCLESVMDIQMRFLPFLVETEHNGAYLNRDILSTNQAKIEIELKELLEKLVDVYKLYFPSEVLTQDFKFLSNDKLSVLLFGGTLFYPKEEIQLDEHGNKRYYKSGERIGQWVKKKVKTPVKIDGVGLVPYEGKEAKKEGFYATSDDVLKKYLNSPQKDLVKLILDIRTMQKDFSTYYIGYRELLWEDTGLIHPNYNQTATRTGRLSSSNPNLQNISHKKEDE